MLGSCHLDTGQSFQICPTQDLLSSLTLHDQLLTFQQEARENHKCQGTAQADCFFHITPEES